MTLAAEFHSSFINPAQSKRNWKPREDELETIELPFSNGIRLGSERCAAIGLIRGDCQEQHQDDSIYCYYHKKVAIGLVEPPVSMYPIWPLPVEPWQFTA